MRDDKVIYVSDLMDKLVDDFSIDGPTLRKVKQHIDDTTEVDAVEVVRCKDCKKYRTDSCAMSYTDRNENMPHYWARTNDFCSYGERKEK